jgi:PAS domain-containing protein
MVKVHTKGRTLARGFMDKIKLSLEAIAWFAIAATSGLLLMSTPNWLRVILGESAGRIARERVVPAEILSTAKAIAAECAAGPLKYHLNRIVHYEYDPLYNIAVDRTTFSIVRLAWTHKAAQDLNGAVAECLASGLDHSLMLSDKDAIVPEVFWIMLWLKDTDQVAIWPSILPSRSRSEALAASLAWRVTLPQPTGNANWAHEGYDDFLTSERIVDISDNLDMFPSRHGVVIVSLRDVSMPNIFKVTLVVNFCAIVIFCILNWVTRRRLSNEEFVSWYRAWLCWALVYAAYALVHLVRLPFLDFSGARRFLLNAAPVFSIANDAFFVIVALYMLRYKGRRQRYKIALISGLIALGLFVLTQALIAEMSRVTGRVVEAGYSVAVSLLFGLAFYRVLNKRRAGISGLELLGSQSATLLAASFFLFLSGHQILIAVWRGRPGLEEIFWILSPVTKVCLMALFFMTELTDRYWGEGEVALAVFNRLEQGVIAVDQKYRIINVNESGSVLLGLARHVMLGKDLREVLFRSLFETEKFFDDLAASQMIKNRRMLTKDYRGEELNAFRVIRRSISAEVVGSLGREGIYALIFLHKDIVA